MPTCQFQADNRPQSYKHKHKNGVIREYELPAVRLSLSVSCVSPPLVPIFGQFLFLSSFVIISSQPCVFSWLVPSPVLLIILFAPFPSLYKSSVFPVSLSSINVISFGVYLFSSDLYVLFTIKCSKEVPRLLVPGTPVHIRDRILDPKQLILFLRGNGVRRQRPCP